MAVKHSVFGRFSIKVLLFFSLPAINIISTICLVDLLGGCHLTATPFFMSAFPWFVLGVFCFSLPLFVEGLHDAKITNSLRTQLTYWFIGSLFLSIICAAIFRPIVSLGITPASIYLGFISIVSLMLFGIVAVYITRNNEDNLRLLHKREKNAVSSHRLAIQKNCEHIDRKEEHYHTMGQDDQQDTRRKVKTNYKKQPPLVPVLDANSIISTTFR